jgi:hypothetical protein
MTSAVDTVKRKASPKATWPTPTFSHTQDVFLPVGRGYHVHIQPYAKHLPPLAYTVDQVSTVATWKRGSLDGKATVTLRVRLLLGNGLPVAMHAQGTLTLGELTGVPEWLDKLINRSLPVVGGEFTGFQVI